MTDLEKAARMALVNICSAKLCQINNMSSRQEMIRLMDEAITALRQALSNSVEQPAKQRHIAYVCPQCHWTLEEQPAQQEHKPWCASLSSLMFKAKRPCDCVRVPLPTAPSSAARSADSAEPFCKPWVGLNAKDLTEIPPSCFEGAIWADAKLKEKNT